MIMQTIYSSDVKIDFKSNKDAKVSLVRLKWIPIGASDYIVCEKAFDNTSIINFSEGDVWQNYTIPSRLEITIAIQSRNGSNASDWSREALIYIDPDDDYTINDGILTGALDGSVTFEEFEEE